MLPSELARYKIQGNKVIPLFATEEDEPLARNIIGMFKEGKKLGDILDEIKILEKAYDTPCKVKLIRGFYKEMLRLCTLSEDSPIDPRIIRREVFSYGPITSREEREKILKEVGEKLKVDVEKYMFSDMEEEKTISSVNRVSPISLIKMYNLSLLQTLLFKSYKMTVQIEGNWKEIIKRIKWLGLMYHAYPNPIRIDIISPATLVKMTEKYGRNMAVILPYIVSSKYWKINAELVLGKKIKRTFLLTVEKFDLIDSKVREEDEKRFDSSVEERFFNDFQKVIKDWKIYREPEALVINGRLFIPDFLVEKNPFKIYVEIVGFWTKEYIREKLEKLRNFKGGEILVLLNQELSKEDFSDFNVIKYKNRVDIGLVYKWLKDYERKNAESVNISYSLEGDVISLKDLSRKLNVSEEIIKKNIHDDKYVFTGNYFVRKDFLEKLKEENFENKKLSELIKIYGDYITEVLEYLGYKFKWLGITDAVVKK
ncbi:DUF790 family protein [Acidianus ambivalens]|uniref:DUF790 family protein n=1 Tax=Acidianus ambivalens TaxID=2283 RepID=A0A650CUZ0_ACIAM|nr:DUF790 family protein [Acidianus ambivalens]MQL55783.1 DUF790 family protein [Acidianus ambivalens]QGR21646.1 DUF790 family protein [Acidianus ambivalens]